MSEDKNNVFDINSVIKQFKKPIAKDANYIDTVGELFDRTSHSLLLMDCYSALELMAKSVLEETLSSSNDYNFTKLSMSMVELLTIVESMRIPSFINQFTLTPWMTDEDECTGVVFECVVDAKSAIKITVIGGDVKRLDRKIRFYEEYQTEFVSSGIFASSSIVTEYINDYIWSIQNLYATKVTEKENLVEMKYHRSHGAYQGTITTVEFYREFIRIEKITE